MALFIHLPTHRRAPRRRPHPAQPPSAAANATAGLAEPGVENPTRMSPQKSRKRPSWRDPETQDLAALPPLLPGNKDQVLAPLPRRQYPKNFRIGDTPPPLLQVERFEASFLRTLSRYVLWSWALYLFSLAVLFDRLRGRDTLENRAIRLRRMFERMGGTLIKIGQQLSMRVDMLPYAYCMELSKLLDNVAPFPVKQAIATIERATGKPLAETFARFDPEPIGSASVACVYQAMLKTGEKVAVKVRRPGIGPAFAADLRALSWLFKTVEWLTLIRPGMTRNFIRELETTFLEELDFRKEVRYQELFRRNAQDRSLTARRFFTAPKVFTELCNHEVITEGFVSGMFLWEILLAVEQKDPASLSRMQELNIDPKVVAKRLMWICQWGNLSNVMFHADPHPANIIVKAKNRIVFIDFGACGTINNSKRNLMLELIRYQSAKDVGGMVKAAVALLEPLPHIDLNAFKQDLESFYWQTLFAAWSKHSKWYERSSGTLWLGFFQLSKKYSIPVNADTVKGIRALLLYDTLALRLDNDLDLIKSGERYMKDVAVLSRKRVQRVLKRRLSSGLRDRDYAKIEDMAKTGMRAFERFQRIVDNPGFNFQSMVEKSVFTVVTVIRLSFFAILVMLMVCGIVMVYRSAVGSAVSLQSAFYTVVRNRYFVVFMAIMVILGVRRILFRLDDQEV